MDGFDLTRRGNDPLGEEIVTGGVVVELNCGVDARLYRFGLGFGGAGGVELWLWLWLWWSSEVVVPVVKADLVNKARMREGFQSH